MPDWIKFPKLFRKIFLSMTRNLFPVIFNGKMCMERYITEKLFPENKMLKKKKVMTTDNSV